MQRSLKILVVRFSSIGDIVLTTPVLRCLKLQLGAEVHFITKSQYKDILTNNIYIDKVHTVENSVRDIIGKLKEEQYNYIVDLHNNLRSYSLKRLRVPTYKICKSNFKKFLFINFGINLLSGTHIVDRYMEVVKPLSVKNDLKGLDYFIDSETHVDFNIEQQFIVWSIGASYQQKKLSKEIISSVISTIDIPVAFLGGIDDRGLADFIIKDHSEKNIYNFCGSFSLDQSSYLIKHARLVLSNDTGLMHIAAAFDKPIISFWGCTKPDLGFSPYMTNKRTVQITSNLSKRPCSKHGNICRYKFDGCVNEIDSSEIIESVVSFLSDK